MTSSFLNLSRWRGVDGSFLVCGPDYLAGWAGVFSFSFSPGFSSIGFRFVGLRGTGRLRDLVCGVCLCVFVCVCTIVFLFLFLLFIYLFMSIALECE